MRLLSEEENIQILCGTDTVRGRWGVPFSQLPQQRSKPLGTQCKLRRTLVAVIVRLQIRHLPIHAHIASLKNHVLTLPFCFSGRSSLSLSNFVFVTTCVQSKGLDTSSNAWTVDFHSSQHLHFFHQSYACPTATGFQGAVILTPVHRNWPWGLRQAL